MCSRTPNSRCTVSIISRGQALGYTMQLPAEDHFLKSRREMLDDLAVFLGGRVAEELMCDDITSGASNDLERATKMAREMVTRLGMSDELGTQVFGEAQHQVFLGRDYADHQDYSEETARRIDAEVQRIMREAHERAVEIISARREQMDLMARVLLERETVEGDAVTALLDNEWDAYLEREGDIVAAKEARNDAAANGADPAVVDAERARRAKPRQSDEEIAAEAAAFAQAAVAGGSKSRGRRGCRVWCGCRVRRGRRMSPERFVIYRCDTMCWRCDMCSPAHCFCLRQNALVHG